MMLIARFQYYEHSQGGVYNDHMILFHLYINRIHLHDDVSLHSVAEHCHSNTTGADLYALCNEATKLSLCRTINDLEAKGGVIITMATNYCLVMLLGLSDDEWTPPLLVTNDDFLTAVSQLKPSVSEAELDNYRNLREKIGRK